MNEFRYINKRGDNAFLDFTFDMVTGVQPIALDTETTSLDIFTCDFLLLQVNVENHIYIFDVQTLGKSFISEVVRMIIDSKRLVIMHNAKYDIKVIKHNLNMLITNVHDTMWIETLLNCGVGEVLYSLATLVDKYIGITLEKATRKDFYTDFVGITQEMLTYSALDVAYLPDIYKFQFELISNAKEVEVMNTENRLVPVVAMMEYNGIKLDKESWTKMAEANLVLLEKAKNNLQELLLDSIDYTKYNTALEAVDALKIPVKTKRDRQPLETITGENAIKEVVKTLVNFSSHAQMLTILNALGVPLKNTNEKTMKDLKGKYSVIDKILEFRELEKKESSYGLNFLNNIHPVTGRIHTEYLNIGTATGRFSSNRPNLQQVPREASYRDCFIPEEGKSLLAIDFSQQEYRLVGAITGEPVIIQAYKDGLDMHTATACMLFNKKPEEIVKSERDYAKSVNFAIIYGSTEHGLSFNLKISVERGREILDNFYKGYPVLAAFKRVAEDTILSLKYSVTLLGRRRYFEDEPLFADSKELSKFRGRIKREGFNHIIQGTGADVTKLSMIDMFYNNPFGDKYKLLLQVHDEVVLEVDDDIAQDALVFTQNCMERVEQQFLGDTPAKADPALGKKWIH